MVEDDDLSLHSYDESDFLLDDGNDASTEDSPEPPKEPQGPVKDHRLSPGKVSGPVSGKTGLSPLETSAPRTLAEALRALPSAVAPPSPDNVPRPLTPLSPVVITPSSTENFPYRRSPRLAPITNLSVTAPTGERKYKKGIFPGSPRYSSSREEKTHKLTLLYLLVQNIQEGKVNKKKKCKAKKVVKQKKAGKMQQMENVGGSKEEDKKRK
ncbi:uncharacterized protein LOC116367424 isoform X2 [Oncorhynchus kisutch]|uniref:uncharacterized protein LOC116364978 isoform X1 n=1 Tax=Oncorhynchus kisutch TaxID=8019 RepID=UPI0012DEFA95|nr:uncharacterized protein LOC116364978 isoform X1 [Oncorhynchus kisutch]XP_031673618.1 uncharacterized protein LOC116364978 isoform X1 [Oncorhynchus kisutch]XP_031673619.1 uncharacterized protein LOC116364978 isoform X1 [Oncorhynchus kisutch]XP_031673638.1 uncharacterized protein LOC116364996 isoform X2 [Oncorhynchus kisutch]XP_031674722.1 uncharacterized protein LOC116367424 isoform X2 [Oncorhynchus kisutch]